MLELSEIEKRYSTAAGPIQVLRGVSERFADGEVCAIVGGSGSGKSTLLNIVGLLDRPDAGQIRLNDQALSGQDAAEIAALRNRHVGFIFQSFHLLPRLTALDNVALPLIYRGYSESRRRRLAAAMLERVGLSERQLHKPAELSGGQRQRVAIARALVGEPSLLLADEPTGNLDESTAAEIMALLLDISAAFHTTILMVTHDRAIAERCDRSLVMEGGRISPSKLGVTNG